VKNQKNILKMNSVLNRASLVEATKHHHPPTIQKLPSNYRYSGQVPAQPVPSLSQHGIIKWRNQSTSSHCYRRSQQLTSNPNSAKSKLNSSHNHKQLSRSSSSDIITADKKSGSVSLQKPSGLGKIETTESIIEMHKFFKEKQIYSSSNHNYKRRTIVLVKNSNGSRVSSTDLNNLDFGFHLQSYGLVNTITQVTEFICFVENVQPASPAKHAGLNNGDVVLAIDCIPINEFKNLNEIMQHVRGKKVLFKI